MPTMATLSERSAADLKTQRIHKQKNQGNCKPQFGEKDEN
jgi:hypothetical protein